MQILEMSCRGTEEFFCLKIATRWTEEHGLGSVYYQNLWACILNYRMPLEYNVPIIKQVDSFISSEGYFLPHFYGP